MVSRSSQPVPAVAKTGLTTTLDDNTLGLLNAIIIFHWMSDGCEEGRIAAMV
jgi:hypothetical protein